MSTSFPAKKLASPFSTGGGGDDLQGQVGAYYLAGLLTGHVPRGLEVGTIEEVRFQRLYEGEPLDDLVCVAGTITGLSKLSLQIKNDLTFGEKDDLFNDVMAACWQTFNSPKFDRTRDRFGIVLGVYKGKIDEHYQSVLTWARNSASAATFLARIRQKGLSHKNHRDFVALIRSKLDAVHGQPVSDDDLWGFLRSMVILHFDLHSSGSRDATHAVNCLQQILQPGSGPGAAELFSRLRDFSAEANRSAGEYTRETLLQRLVAAGFRLLPAPYCREDLARLEVLREHILDDIRTDIDGLTLNRVEAVEGPIGHFGDAAILLLTGPPGVGKSGIWKMLVERHGLAGPAMVLSADRIEGTGWLGFAQSQGISRNADELLLAMSTHPFPCVFIEAIDRIEDKGARLAINDILRTAEKLFPPIDGRRRWWCIAMAREGSLAQLTWLDRKIVQQIFPVRIPELVDEEVRLVLSQQPRLAALSSQARLKPILRNPFLLDLITDRRFAGDEADNVPATEIEVSDIWWERVVGRDGQAEGRERQQALVQAASRLIKAPRKRFPDGGMPPDALVTLEADRIIVRDQGQNVYRFGHDLLEDWALLRLLEQRRHDLPAYVQELGQPHGLLRSIRLLGCMLFEGGDTAGEWTELLRSFEQAAHLAPRWRQAVLTAPFLSTRLEELLDKARETLLAEDGRILIELLIALRTTEVDVDPRIAEHMATIADSPAEALALALQFPLPRWYAWYRTLEWLLRHTPVLSEAARHEAARIIEIWQERSGPSAPLRREVGELAHTWLEENVEDLYVAKSKIDYGAREEHESRLRKILLHSADVLPDRVTEYIRTAVEDNRWKAKEQILKTFVPLVDHIPAAYVDFALGELIKAPEEAGWASLHDMSKLGIGGAMDHHPPAHVQGPHLRLLRTHEDEGLRLLHGLTNAATDYWRRREQYERFLGYSRSPLPVVLSLPSGPKELWGNEDVYCWFRHTSVGPYAVISALMALEVWMEEQIASGRDGGELIDMVMGGTRSVAVLGVCIAVALGTSGRCLPALLPYIANPLVWRMDICRRGKDLQGPPIIDFPGRHEHINEQLRERNQLPQRGLDVRNLVPLVVMQGEDSARDALDQAFAAFINEPPFQYKEERAREEVIRALRAEIEDYRGLLKRENYQQVQTESATGWRYQPPREPSPEEHLRFEQALKSLEYFGLANWARTTLDANTPPDMDNLDRVVRAAFSYYRPKDFSESLRPDPTEAPPKMDYSVQTSIYSPDWTLNSETEPIRKQAIAAVAAAVAVKAWSWAQEQGHSDRCRTVLLAAARCPRNRFDTFNRRNVFDLDPRLNGARGLTALVAQGADDEEVRLAVLRQIFDPQLQVVGAVFAGLRSSWGSNDVFCWNCLWVALALAKVPGDTVVPGMGLAFNKAGMARLKQLWQRSTDSLQRGEKPELPAIEVDAGGFFLWDLVVRVLQGLPIEELTREPGRRQALLGLIDGLMRWTVSENQSGDEEDRRSRRRNEAPWEWNDFFLGWVAALAGHLTPEEAEEHVIAPVLATLPQLPRLTAELLHGLFRYQVARLPPQEPPDPRAVQTWERLCNDLLGRPELARLADQEYLASDWSEAVTLMVFVSHGTYILKDEWSHVSAFVSLIKRWLAVVGTNHDAYQAFLSMLKSAYCHYQPAQVVGWLYYVTSLSKDTTALWKSSNNGERTARVLHMVWQASRSELTGDRGVFQQFSELVDRLAAHGITLASVIQQDLEGSTAG